MKILKVQKQNECGCSAMGQGTMCKRLEGPCLTWYLTIRNKDLILNAIGNLNAMGDFEERVT